MAAKKATRKLSKQVGVYATQLACIFRAKQIDFAAINAMLNAVQYDPNLSDMDRDVIQEKLNKLYAKKQHAKPKKSKKRARK